MAGYASAIREVKRAESSKKGIRCSASIEGQEACDVMIVEGCTPRSRQKPRGRCSIHVLVAVASPEVRIRGKQRMSVETMVQVSCSSTNVLLTQSVSCKPELGLSAVGLLDEVYLASSPANRHSLQLFGNTHTLRALLLHCNKSMPSLLDWKLNCAWTACLSSHQ